MNLKYFNEFKISAKLNTLLKQIEKVLFGFYRNTENSKMLWQTENVVQKSGILPSYSHCLSYRTFMVTCQFLFTRHFVLHDIDSFES